MTNLFFLVGLPASGKSFLANKLVEEENATIISSDEYRKREYGSEEIQGDNKKLFELIHKDTIELLKNGKSVVFDSTGLSYKNRKAFLDKLAEINVGKICILLATPYEVCIERNKNRTRNVPESVIKRMRENFNVPLYSEGWDKIEIVYDDTFLNDIQLEDKYLMETFMKVANNFNQDNPHHRMTLGEHCLAVADGVAENEVDFFIYLSALLHDVGKLYTKVFVNSKGEPSDIAHYYNHENVGAYEALFYLATYINIEKDILFGCGLINYHMRPYGAKTEKAVKKLENTIGSDMYYFLKIIHEADKKAH